LKKQLIEMATALEQNSLAEIKKYQGQKLAGLLQYLQAHSPYYRELFGREKIDIAQIRSVDDLVNIPTTTKQQFGERNMDFLCVDKTAVVDYTTTSGTTGKPVTVALTENDLQRLAINEANSFVIAGAKKGDVFQLMLTLDRQFMAGMAYFLGLQKLGAGIVRSGPASPQMQLENILRFKPDAVVAVPSFLLKLAEYAGAHGVNLNDTAIKRAICIGEPVRSTQLNDNTLANRLHEKWNLPLYGTYASTEMQTAFTECEHGAGGHHQPDLIIVEILDDAGNQLPAGDFGEVTITTLGVEGMPLLRYRTGDICCYYEEPCKCGRNTIRLSPVTGRKNQMLKYKGTTLFPPAIYDALSAVPEVKDYIVEVVKNELDNDEVIINISQNGNLDIVEAKLKNALQVKLRVLPALNFVSSQHLQNMRPAESRKPVMIIFR
jgi:phenylacetate-CoA ligase